MVTGLIPSSPGSCLPFLSRIGFSNPTARRFFIEFCSHTIHLRFPQVNLRATKSPNELIESIQLVSEQLTGLSGFQTENRRSKKSTSADQQHSPSTSNTLNTPDDKFYYYCCRTIRITTLQGDGEFPNACPGGIFLVTTALRRALGTAHRSTSTCADFW